LGASVANLRIADSDDARAAQTFAEFAALCRAFDLRPCIEFVGFDDPDTVPRVVRIIDAAGEGALTVDALHVARSGTSLEYLRALDPAKIGYVQLCDGPLRGTLAHYPYEGFFDRMAPGEGEFPLAALIEAMPAHLPISLEVPGQSARKAGMTATDWARHVVETAKGVLDVSAR
jgi:sugar phosphate isomerase/epimerase